ESADTCRGPYGIAHPGNRQLNPSAQALKVSIPVSASVVLPTDGFQRLTTKSQVKCRDLSSDRFHQMVIQSARKLMQGTIADTHKISAKSIQRILRHKNVTTTERYIQNINHDLEATINLLKIKSSQNGLTKNSEDVGN